MAKRTKQRIAFFMALVLTLSTLPVVGMAAETDNSADSVAVETEPDAADTALAETDQEAGGGQVVQMNQISDAEGDSEAEEDTEPSPQTASSDDNDTPATYATTDGVATSAYDPYAGVLYSYSDDVDGGIIRYVSQNPSGKHYQDSYWGEKAGKSKYLCKSANVSMMLSYLGLEMLPKDIIKDGGDNKCMKKSWGKAKVETGDADGGLTFAEAMDNYLNGGGLYSPPMIRLANDCFSSGQHYVIVISKMSEDSYEVLDTYNRDFYADDGIWTMKASGNKITQFYRKNKTYTSTFTEIYQYHVEQTTQLKGASKPKTMTAGGIFQVKGQLYGDETITKVTVGCYNKAGEAQSACCQTAKPNSVGYDLANMNNKLKFNQLDPGVYKYVVKATTASGTKTYLSKVFVVLAKEATVGDATFYLDSNSNVKYCAMPSGKSNGNNVNICLTKNSESSYMRFRADYVGDGYYTLAVVGSGKYLTVYKSQNKSGIRVIQNSMVNRNGQYWQILPTGDGNYYLVPKCATSCTLSLDKEDAAAGVKLETQTADLGTEQGWLMRYVRPLVSGLKNTSSGVRVKWGAVPNTSGYRVYRKTADDTSWTLVKTIGSGKTTSWTDTKVTNGVQYTYAMRSVYGKQTSPACPKRSTYRLTAPTILTPKNTGKGQINVSWKANSKGSGYQICYASNSAFKSNKTVTVSGRRTLSKVLTQLSKGKTYYLKVRAYKTVSGEKYYSTWSAQKSLKLTK